MKNLLYVTPEASNEELNVKLADSGYRVKLCHDSATALKWLTTRAFHALVVDGSYSIPHLLSLAKLLWKRTPEAPCWVIDLHQLYALDSATLRVRGLDVAIGAEGERELLESLKKAADQSAFDRESFPILVVEDLDSPRDIICIFLESLGFPKVVGTASAKEALNLLESGEEQFACVVTDIQMPQISGKEMLEIIRGHPRLLHLPVIVLTAHGTVDVLIECLIAGASGFLVKPPKKDDMLRELSRAVRIAAGIESPRLASPSEAEHIRRELESSRGV